MSYELIKLNNVYHHYHQRDLFFDITGTILNTDKIGLIGHNGSGKTTLLKFIIGESYPFRGEVKLETKRYGYIPQIIDSEVLKRSENLSIYDFCMSLNLQNFGDYLVMKEFEEQISTDYEKYLESLSNFQSNGGYEYQSTINQLLSIAGFDKENHNQLFISLSEGQKRLIYLVSMIALNNEILIMDEPTNHVDSELKQKYIKLIKEYRGAVLVVSHDRELLSQACNKIWEIEDKELHTYNGGWEFYKTEHELRLKLRFENHQKAQKETERLEDLLDKTYKGEVSIDIGSLHKRIAREKTKLERVPPSLEKEKVKGSISYEGKYSEFMLRLKDFNLFINEKHCIENLNISLQFKDKLVLKGSNGTGKSTILKLILERCDYATYTGEIKVGESAKIGYFSQTLDLGNESLSLMEYIRDLYKCELTKAYSLMHKYLFAKEQKDQRVFEMSGGEKNRLQLMNLIEGNYNLLLLDEPTNHLDIYAIEKLEELLQDFNGSILLISHDKYFVEKVATSELNLNDFKVK